MFSLKKKSSGLVKVGGRSDDKKKITLSMHPEGSFTTLTRTCCWSFTVSQINSGYIITSYLYKFHLLLPCHLRQGLQNLIFPSGFPTGSILKMCTTFKTETKYLEKLS